MQSIALIGLLAIDLPGHAIRLCDGGFIVWSGETYRGADSVFGTVGAVDTLTEGFGDSVPALSVTLLPPSGSAPAVLSAPGHQTSQVRFILAQYDVVAGTVVSAEVQFVGQVDTTNLTIAKGRRELAVNVTSLAERLFEGNIGNTLSPVWHKSIWPGELGHDNATGLTVPVAWGTERPVTVYSGGGGGGIGPGRNGDFGSPAVRQQ